MHDEFMFTFATKTLQGHSGQSKNPETDGPDIHECM